LPFRSRKVASSSVCGEIESLVVRLELVQVLGQGGELGLGHTGAGVEHPRVARSLRGESIGHHAATRTPARSRLATRPLGNTVPVWTSISAPHSSDIRAAVRSAWSIQSEPKRTHSVATTVVLEGNVELAAGILLERRISDVLRAGRQPICDSQ
jgi:hypothetical protein